MKVGDLVQIVSLEDDCAAWLECELTRKFVGRFGFVVASEAGTGGVGDSPDDPLWIVEVSGLGKDGFWGEELKFVA